MNARFYPSTLTGTTESQAFKSLAMRYFILASVADGKTEIYLKNEAEDLSVIKEGFSDLGVYFSRNKNVYTVTPPETWESFYMRVDVKSSLVALRLMLPLLLTKSKRIELSGTGKLTKKDVTAGMELLKGIVFDSKTLPALVGGELKAGEYIVLPEINKELICSLIMALPLLNGDSVIKFITVKKEH